MIARKDLHDAAISHLKDAEVLFAGDRYDGAIYLCGYAIELALKARICHTLKWKEFPHTGKEFEQLKSFQSHNFDLLLRLSGEGDKVREEFTAEWGVVSQWNPESRYVRSAKTTLDQTRDMIESTKRLLGVI